MEDIKDIKDIKDIVYMDNEGNIRQLDISKEGKNVVITDINGFIKDVNLNDNLKEESINYLRVNVSALKSVFSILEQEIEVLRQLVLEGNITEGEEGEIDMEEVNSNLELIKNKQIEIESIIRNIEEKDYLEQLTDITVEVAGLQNKLESIQGSGGVSISELENEIRDLMGGVSGKVDNLGSELSILGRNMYRITDDLGELIPYIEHTAYSVGILENNTVHLTEEMEDVGVKVDDLDNLTNEVLVEVAGLQSKLGSIQGESDSSIETLESKLEDLIGVVNANNTILNVLLEKEGEDKYIKVVGVRREGESFEIEIEHSYGEDELKVHIETLGITYSVYENNYLLILDFYQYEEVFPEGKEGKHVEKLRFTGGGVSEEIEVDLFFPEKHVVIEEAEVVDDMGEEFLKLTLEVRDDITDVSLEVNEEKFKVNNLEKDDTYLKIDVEVVGIEVGREYVIVLYYTVDGEDYYEVVVLDNYVEGPPSIFLEYGYMEGSINKYKKDYSIEELKDMGVRAEDLYGVDITDNIVLESVYTRWSLDYPEEGILILELSVVDSRGDYKYETLIGHITAFEDVEDPDNFVKAKMNVDDGVGELIIETEKLNLMFHIENELIELYEWESSYIIEDVNGFGSNIDFYEYDEDYELVFVETVEIDLPKTYVEYEHTRLSVDPTGDTVSITMRLELIIREDIDNVKVIANGEMVNVGDLEKDIPYILEVDFYEFNITEEGIYTVTLEYGVEGKTYEVRSDMYVDDLILEYI